MMATYFIYAFIYLGMFIQGLGALQFLSEARIYPQRSDVTVDAGTDLTLGCRGIEPMRWAFHDDFNGPQFNTSEKNITHMYNENELEYKYETLLTVFNVSHVNVGFYYCHGAEANFDTPRRSSRIYVFIHDHNHLSVITSEEHTYVLTPWVVSVPCRPTAQDINITLTCYDPIKGNVTMSANTGNYTAVHHDKRHMGTFSSYGGFSLEHDNLRLYDCSCEFTRNNETSTLQLRHNDQHFHYFGTSIESPAIADVGDDLTMQCAYLSYHSFPYDKYWLYWEFPTSGNKLTEILQIVKLKSAVLVINIIRKNNISNEDEGSYKCKLNIPVTYVTDNISKYVYVNDTERRGSAPRISSPSGGEVQVNSGENLTLRCAGSQPVTWTRSWRDEDDEYDVYDQVYKSHNITYVSNPDGLYETHLHLTDTSSADVGLYHCHENGSKMDHPFKSDEIYIFVKDEQNLYVLQNIWMHAYPYTNVTLPCLPTSRDVNVSLSMMFKAYNRNTSRYGPAQKIIPVIYAYDPREGFTVQAPGPDPGEATATCTFVTETASNTLVIRYSTYNDIESDPWITGPDEDLVFVGQTLELSCAVYVHYNVPDDALHWTPPNHVTSTEIIVKIQRINFERGKVLISNLTLHDVSDRNEGRYFCHLASNNATTNRVISVYDEFAVEKPIILNLTYVYAYIGQPLVLRCNVTVSHNVDVRMSWTTPNDTVIQVNDVKYIPNIKNTTGQIILKIDNTTYEHEGNYTCNVFYSKSGRNFTTKNILVKNGIKARIVTSNFKNLEHIVVPLEGTVNLTCSAVGDPKPEITWLKDSSEVRRLGQHIGFAADNSELTIHYVQRFDAGLYTCIAKNPFGQDSRVVNLSLQAGTV